MPTMQFGRVFYLKLNRITDTSFLNMTQDTGYTWSIQYSILFYLGKIVFLHPYQEVFVFSFLYMISGIIYQHNLFFQILSQT